MLEEKNNKDTQTIKTRTEQRDTSPTFVLARVHLPVNDLIFKKCQAD